MLWAASTSASEVHSFHEKAFCSKNFSSGDRSHEHVAQAKPNPNNTYNWKLDGLSRLIHGQCLVWLSRVFVNRTRDTETNVASADRNIIISSRLRKELCHLKWSCHFNCLNDSQVCNALICLFLTNSSNILSHLDISKINLVSSCLFVNRIKRSTNRWLGCRWPTDYQRFCWELISLGIWVTNMETSTRYSPGA